jgi:hypothetical protein
MYDYIRYGLSLSLSFSRHCPSSSMMRERTDCSDLIYNIVSSKNSCSLVKKERRKERELLLTRDEIEHSLYLRVQDNHSFIYVNRADAYAHIQTRNNEFILTETMRKMYIGPVCRRYWQWYFLLSALFLFDLIGKYQSKKILYLYKFFIK